MLDREKIELIVKEVVKQLSAAELTSSGSTKPILLIFGDTSLIEKDQWVQLQSSWDIVPHQEGEKLHLDQVNQVLFLNATQDLLAKGALGLFDTPESKWLSRCLMELVPVSIIPTIYLQEHLFTTNPSNKAYVFQLHSYKETLKKFGVKIETLAKFIGDKIEPNVPKQKIESNSGLKKKRLLTHRDVQDCMEEFIEVDATTIITPLARDTAREMGKDIRVHDSKGAK